VTASTVARLFEDPRAVLKRHGLRPKRSWGQNFLVSGRAVAAITALCVDRPGRHVIEIGAGLGTLTGALLEAGGQVTAIERDPDMCRVLEAEFGGRPGFVLARADAATFDYAQVLSADPGVLAGNLPYQLTGRILRRVIDGAAPFVRAVLMVQAEVADRVVAAPGSRTRGALSALLQSRFGVEIALTLQPKAFVPPPAVRSAVIVLEPRAVPLFGDLPAADFDAAVRAAFAGRRKTVRNSLLQAGAGDAAAIAAALHVASIDPGARAEVLTNEELVALARALALRG
jgi:16S rRNA (adenine1518-N6/adenine1519-N6)-dimethyltransferase